MDFQAVSNIHSSYCKSTVISKIHPNDGMHRSGAQHYDVVGRDAIKIILSGLTISWTQQIARVLDIPSGYGRVARHLRAAFPGAEMFFCDIEKEGADFCAETFGGEAIHSQPDLTAVTLPKNLDLIWIGSLFTHVDESRTKSWINYLVEHLGDQGVLVATFHGLYFPELVKRRKMIGTADWEAITRGYNATGYGYSSYGRADLGDYGISLSKPSKVMDIATEVPGTRVISYTERGWAGNHDVLILSKNDRLKVYSDS